MPRLRGDTWPVFPSDLDLPDEERQRALEEEQAWVDAPTDDDVDA